MKQKFLAYLQSKNGTIIIYDDFPETLAKISINILKNKEYNKILSEKAIQNIKHLSNDKIYINLIINTKLK